MINSINRYSFSIDILRNGVEYGKCEIYDSATIRMDSSAEIKKSLSANLVLPQGVNFFKDKLRVKIIVNNTEYLSGEYYIGTVTKNIDDYGIESYYIEGYDGCYLPSRYRSESILHVSKGEKYVDVIKLLLIQTGVIEIDVVDNQTVFKTEREDWEIGTSYLEIINDLLSEINYESLWFDNKGVAHINPKIKISGENIKYKYGTDSNVEVKTNIETDIYDKYNVFTAYVDSPDNDTVMIATSTNDDPDSILSVQARGRIQAPPKRLDNIANQAELQAYVDNLKLSSRSSIETTTITTPLEGGHDINDIVQYKDNLYIETSWELTLDSSTLMTHNIKREVYL